MTATQDTAEGAPCVWRTSTTKDKCGAGYLILEWQDGGFGTRALVFDKPGAIRAARVLLRFANARLLVNMLGG